MKVFNTSAFYNIAIGLIAIFFLLSCTKSKEEALQDLLQYGVITSALDVGSPKGEQALIQAISQKETKIARLLLTAGASSNASSNGTTALLAAIRADEPNLAIFLIEQGANVNFTGKGGITPLMEAAFQGENDVLDTLLANGADVLAKDETGWTALMSACAESGNVSRLMEELGYDDHLSEHSKRKSRKNDVKTQTDIFNKLLAAGAEYTETELPWISPLLIAESEGNTTIARALMERFNNEDTPLELNIVPTIWAENEKAAKELVAMGADIHKRFHSITALEMATRKGNTSLVSWLCNTSDVHFSQEELNDALFEGVRQENVDCVKQLINKGANVQAKHDIYLSPLTCAIIHSTHEMAALLLQEGADPHDSDLFKILIHQGHRHHFEFMLHSGTSINDIKLPTPLVYYLINEYVYAYSADNNRQMDILALLDIALDAGANVNAVNDNGETALHYILTPWVRTTLKENDFFLLLGKLLKAGANANATESRFGETPMHTLFRDDYKDSSNLCEITQLLIDYGASPMIHDKNGKIPMDYFSTYLHRNEPELEQALSDIFIRTLYYKFNLKLIKSK